MKYFSTGFLRICVACSALLFFLKGYVWKENYTASYYIQKCYISPEKKNHLKFKLITLLEKNLN